MQEKNPNSPLQVMIEDKLPVGQTILFGAQHLFGLTGIWVFPGIIGAVLGLETAVTGYIVQMCFLTTGLVTILQSSKMLKLPIVQGPTAAFFVAVMSVGATQGLDVAYGSMFVAGLIFLVLTIPIGKLGVMGNLGKLISPPIVFGALLLIIGGQLAAFGVSGWFGSAGTFGYPSFNFVISIVTVVVVLCCMVFGGNTIIRRGALLWGIIVGTIIYGIFGEFNGSAIAAAHLVSLPSIFPFGFAVNGAVVVLMAICFFMATAEAIGMYTLVTTWDPQPLPVNRINRGLFGEVLGCTLGAMFGGLATTSYPENIGIIRVTGIGSRWVTMTAGIIAVILGIFPIIGTTIASIPTPVTSAAATVLFGIIAISGVQVLLTVVWDELNVAVVATSFIVALGTQFLPADITANLSATVSTIVTQPMLIGLFCLLGLNIIINLIIRPLLKHEKPAEPAAH